MDRNHWTNFKERIAGWNITFPPIQQGGTERLIEFVDRVERAGTSERVYRILQTPDPYAYLPALGISYAEHVREILDRTGNLPLFHGGGPGHTYGGQLRTPALVAYYDSSSICEEEVEDMGLLLRRLRPLDIMDPEDPPTAMRRVCPVVLDAPKMIVRPPPGKEAYRRPVRVSIQLETDIWFPRVLGFLDREDDTDPRRGPDDMYDNSALAARHTPRLNRFIEAVREAALDLGAQWELEAFEEPGLHIHYTPMCHEAGINLDPPPVARA